MITGIKLYLQIFTLSLIFFSNALGIDNLLHNFKETPLGYFNDQPDICRGRYVNTLNTRLKVPVELPIDSVKDQGPVGTCTTQVVSTCYEMGHPSFRASVGEFTILAETHLDEVDGGDCLEGLFLGATLNIGARMGFVEDSRLPYEETYIQYIARINGINIRKSGWKEELNKLIKKNEEENKSLQVCHKQYDNPRDNYNATMESMGNPLRLYGKPEIDITSHRLSCMYIIHHISQDDLSRHLTKSRCMLPSGTIGIPGGVNIDAIRHALSSGYPVAVALGITQQYQYIPNYYDTENKRQYYIRTTQGSPWDTGRSIIDLPKGCYRDSNSDVPLEFTDGLKRVFGPGYDALAKGILFELRGSHAIILRGFNDVLNCFSLLNSWGRTWGNSGLANITFDYVRLFATEIYVVAKN